MNKQPQIRAVFLDRDGVLNKAAVRGGKPYPPGSLRELIIPDEIVPPLQRLRNAGFLLIGITNQPDVARGNQTRNVADQINQHVVNRLKLDDLFVCYHDDRDGCECRKPKPGLLFQAAQKHNIDLSASFLIGDRWKDIEAGRQAGCGTVFLDQHYLEPRPEHPDFVAENLSQGTACILARIAERMSVRSLSEFKVKIFADGANLAEMQRLYSNPLIGGFTTNPTLMRKAGVSDYRAFALEVLRAIPDRPISFEVFSDEFQEMKSQALLIAGWGNDVYVKIPITNTRGETSIPLIRDLSHEGIKVNVTAVMTLAQVHDASLALRGGAPAYISLFAGRIADTGRDPAPIVAAAVELLRPAPSQELIWASPREVLNVYQADQVGCHIITATPDILNKLSLIGKDLGEFSIDTVKMFREDALKAAYKI